MKSFDGSASDLDLAPVAVPYGATSFLTGAHRLTVVAALVLADLLGFCIAFGLLAGVGLLPVDLSPAIRLGAGAVAACLALNALSGLYPGYGLHQHEQLRRRLVSAGAVAGAFGLAAFALSGGLWMSFQLVAFLTLAMALQLVLASLARRLLWRAGSWGQAVDLIDGVGLGDFFQRHWEYGMHPVSVRRVEDSLMAGRDGGLMRRAAQPDTVLVAAGSVPSSTELKALGGHYARVIVLADLPEHRVSGLQPRDLNGRIGLVIERQRRSFAGEAARRLLDLAIAIPGAIVAAPLIALSALAIKAVDSGSPFFRHAREGRDGQQIGVLKLRTMYGDAEDRLKAVLASDPEAAAQWETHFKLQDDPRILPGVGKLLRASSCDELPQIFNVIRGDMGIVGPRPFPEYHLAAMDPAFRYLRSSVTPGITGLWQVSERSNADIEQQQQLDGFYIANQSIWLDIQIIFRTFGAVLGGNGAR